MHGCICPFAVDTRISAFNTARDRNSPVKMRQINPRNRSSSEYRPFDGVRQLPWVCGAQAFDTPGPVLVGVHFGLSAEYEAVRESLRGQHLVTEAKIWNAAAPLLFRWRMGETNGWHEK